MSSLLFVLLLIGVASATPKAKFDTKIVNLATDMVVNYLVNQSTWDQITAGLESNAIGLVPSTKYLGAMGMLSTFTSCLNKAGVSMSDAMSTLSAAFKKILNAPYTKIIKKMKTMSTAKKTSAQMSTQAYTIATAALTKALVQKMINAAKTASSSASWNCAMVPLNTVMKTSQYNMVWSKSG